MRCLGTFGCASTLGLGLDISSMNPFGPDSGSTSNTGTTYGSTSQQQSSGSSWMPSYSAEKQAAKDAGNPDWWAAVTSSFSAPAVSTSAPDAGAASVWSGSTTGSDLPPQTSLPKASVPGGVANPALAAPAPHPLLKPALVVGGVLAVGLLAMALLGD